MIAAVLVCQLALWASSANAFFVWKPCLADKKCQTTAPTHRTKRDVSGGTKGESSETISFEIVERFVPVIQPRSRRAHRDFARLSRKYEPRQVPDSPAHLGRRENEYVVREPQEPKDSNAEGIFQDEGDYAHFIKAEIGSERKPLYLLLDTGAGTTWIMGSDCSSPACKLHDTYDVSSSTTLEDTPRDFSIAYGSGKVDGHNVVDTIRLGDIEVSMEFGVAHNTSDDFEHFAFDGILGMSLNKGSTENVPRIAKDDEKLTKNLFSVFLSRGPDGPNKGEVTFGGINNDKFSGEITYTDVASSEEGNWAIPVESIKAGGKEATLGKSRLGYIDTGTTYIFGPTADVASLHGLIDGAKSDDGVTWTVPCDTTLELSFTFSGKSWTVLPQDWILAPSEDGTCVSNVYGHEVVKEAWLLGAQFLKNVYTVFDYQGDRSKIGFAKHVNSEAPVAPGTKSVQTPGPTSASTNSPDMGLGGQETASSVSDAQPVSTDSSDDSSDGVLAASSKKISGILVTCATVLSIIASM